jgi:hypothetical protein
MIPLCGQGRWSAWYHMSGHQLAEIVAQCLAWMAESVDKFECRKAWSAVPALSKVPVDSLYVIWGNLAFRLTITRECEGATRSVP